MPPAPWAGSGKPGVDEGDGFRRGFVSLSQRSQPWVLAEPDEELLDNQALLVFLWKHFGTGGVAYIVVASTRRTMKKGLRLIWPSAGHLGGDPLGTSWLRGGRFFFWVLEKSDTQTIGHENIPRAYILNIPTVESSVDYSFVAEFQKELLILGFWMFGFGGCFRAWMVHSNFLGRLTLLGSAMHRLVFKMWTSKLPFLCFFFGLTICRMRWWVEKGASKGT